MSADNIGANNNKHINVGAIPVTDGRFDKGIGPVHMSRVHCNGDELNLLNCSHSNGVRVTNCHHGRDAGVVCEIGMLNNYCTISTRFNAHID